MHRNNHKIVNYDLVSDKEFGKVGTPERAEAERKAYSFFIKSSPNLHFKEGEQKKEKV